MSEEMFDIVLPETRSRMMRAVKRRDTSAELAVRRHLRALGVFYRVRNRDLPGSPDIANRKRKWAIFVHGCFWHGHQYCRKTKGGRDGRIPKTNSAYWSAKIEANRERDERKRAELMASGYRVVVVWECEIRDAMALRGRLQRVLTNEPGAEERL